MQPAIIFAVLTIVVALSVMIGNRPPFAQLEANLADIRSSQLARSDAVDPGIVIIAITDRSLGDNRAAPTIDRHFLAQLMTAVDAAEPAAVGIDILFDRPTLPASDDAFRKSLRSIKSPLVIIGTSAPGPFERSVLAGHQVASPILATDGNDGVVRHFTDLDRLGRPVLAAALANVTGRVNTESKFEIRYGRTASGYLPFRIIPAHYFLGNTALLPALRGRHVLIGGIFDDRDRHATPLRFANAGAQTMPGVLVHAFQLRQLLTSDSRQSELPWSILLVGLAAITGFSMGRSVLPIAVQSGVLLSAIAAFALLGIGLFAVAQIMVHLVAISAALVLAALVGFALEGQRRRAQIRSVRKAFGTFLAPEYVRMLERDPGLVTAAAKQTEIAALFTDLADFTALIERLPPDAIAAFLNTYLDEIVRVIVNSGGTVDKIVGDSVHALFGVPIGQIDAAGRALDCAKEIVRITELRRIAQPVLALGVTRVGVHFGPALVGNFGGSLRLDYTAHGSTMNIASRLETANTALGTQVCVSEAVYFAAGSPAGWRWGGSVLLRGVQAPISFFTLAHNLDGDQATDAALKAIDADPANSRERFQTLDTTDPIVRLQQTRLAQGLCTAMIDLR